MLQQTDSQQVSEDRSLVNVKRKQILCGHIFMGNFFLYFEIVLPILIFLKIFLTKYSWFPCLDL